MAEMKTKPTARSAEAFLQKVDAAKRDDCRALVTLMKKATRAEPTMWGPAIVGFGSCHYKNESGRESDWFIVGFSRRKGDLALYIMPGVDRFRPQLAKLAPPKAGKSCLCIKRLADVDVGVLKSILAESVKQMRSSTRSPRSGE